jgi:hypothetical protein
MLFSGLVPMTTAMTIATPALAQSTTSAMTGVITDFVGNPVSGADVRIIHVPTGTVSRDRTNNQGRFTADNLRPGGPYKVTVPRPIMRRAKKRTSSSLWVVRSK